MENLELVLPEIFISLSIMFLLILGVYKKDSSKLIQNLSLIVSSNLTSSNDATGSRLPVGSSAKIKLGSLIIALAREALCCSPPDSASGK